MVNKKSSQARSAKVAVFSKQHKLLAVLVVILISGLAFYGYQKYLDVRNVSDMKQLLSAFEELKEKVNLETGQNVEIESNCGSVGKFATSYACTLNAYSDIGNIKLAVGLIEMLTFPRNLRCGLHSDIGYKLSDNETEGFGCRALVIRKSNRAKAESLFYDYDVSPGRAF